MYLSAMLTTFIAQLNEAPKKAYIFYCFENTNAVNSSIYSHEHSFYQHSFLNYHKSTEMLLNSFDILSIIF